MRRCLDETCRRILVQALVISRLDYCNSVLSGLPSSTLQPLSSVLHTADRLTKDLSPRDRITVYTETTALASRQSMHARIAFKISLLSPHVSHPFWNLSNLHHTCHPWLRYALLPGPEDADHPRERIWAIFSFLCFCVQGNEVDLNFSPLDKAIHRLLLTAVLSLDTILIKYLMTSELFKLLTEKM